MHDAYECHRNAVALADLAEMFPERASQYWAEERRWRDLEIQANKSNRLAGDPN
jgi:hypothetical protein